MSMTTLVILRFIGIFAAYSGITVALPAVMFRRILKGRRISEQFLMCYTFGNFYIINIVFAVQLLHISNFFTLTILTVVLSALIWSRVNRIPLRKKLAEAGNLIRKMLEGSLGLRSAIWDLGRKCKSGLQWSKSVLYWKCVRKPVQTIFLLIICGCLFWIYGRQIVLAYGYRASDIPVHLNWINQMSRGHLFSNGVYPFGFHCIVYYLHMVFRVDTYIILCEFFFVQVIFIHAVLLAMLRLFCKTAFMPYLGVLIYILGNFWSRQTYSRFYSTLPQEFGMIFVIPSLYFLIKFFRIKKEHLMERETTIILQCFAMAFSLTLAIHFYGTMIAGLCCIGIGLGFGFRFFRKEYFFRIMRTGILSVILAVLPMAIAFVGGTPLQGSLGWGMSVISGSSSKPSAQKDSLASPENSTSASGTTVKVQSSDGTITEIDVSDLPSSSKNEEGAVASATSKVSLKERILQFPEKIRSVVASMARRIREFIISTNTEAVGYVALASIAAVVVMGFLLCLIYNANYGGTLAAIGLSVLILTILLCANTFGFPMLMDGARCSIYYAYIYIAMLSLMADGTFMILPIFRKKYFHNIISLAIGCAVLTLLFQKDLVKQPAFVSDYVTNGAITCLSNIIHENKDETWTIVSANDETQMGLDHGWHYETITFLRKQEKMKVDTEIIIPTETVYFFIEKIPLNYSVEYSESGQAISKKGASQTLPNSGGIGMYQGQGRWILMSRMYYWAQAFMERYPNDMKVYYESDDFVCYKIKQNMYHQYNFAIDYGYNQVEKQEDEN